MKAVRHTHPVLSGSISHYRILAQLGAGGMGVVYRARDTRLGRDVAIKVLPKDFAADAYRLRRFEQEAKTLATLNHPNILTIHDVGVHEGAPYLVSEVLEGRTLRDELANGPLSVRKATEYALQIALGLAAAHAKSVVHRDLKPENIFITRGGLVKLLDFGLAKLWEETRDTDTKPSSGDASTIRIGADDLVNTTAPGMVLGTPGYMSPEQVRGERVDQRTDIFAFGCVCYELLSGGRAFRRSTPVETMSATLGESPPDLSELKPGIPAALSRAVHRCLEKNPENRFQSAKDLAFALETVAVSKGAPKEETAGVEREQRRPGPAPRTPVVVANRGWTWAIALLLLVAGLVWWFFPRSERGVGPIAQPLSNSSNTPATASAVPVTADQKSVAVLPFVNMSADKNDEYLSDGMTEELLNVLAKVRGLHVPGRSSCFSFKGKNEQDIFRKVGEQLHVNAVLEGSVRKAENQLRITAQLINVADGFHLWSETYDRDMTNIFAIQSEIAARVAEALKVELGIEETRALAKKPTENTEAYRLYLLGRYHFAKFTQSGWTNAIHYFDQALLLDPAFAPAYCGLADTYGWMGGAVIPGKEAWAKERTLAQRAVTIDRDLPDARLSLGIALVSAFEWRKGENELKRAIRLNPQLALAHDQYAWLLAITSRFDEAIEEQKRAVELDPLSPLMNADLAWMFHHSRRYDEAIAQNVKTLELDPNYANAHHWLAWSHLLKGEIAEAIAGFEKATVLDDIPWYVGSLAYAYGVSGNRVKAAQILSELQDLADRRYVGSGAFVTTYLGLGEKEKALDWLEKGYEEQDPLVWYLNADPLYDGIRKEPRFQALLKKVGLHK